MSFSGSLKSVFSFFIGFGSVEKVLKIRKFLLQSG